MIISACKKCGEPITNCYCDFLKRLRKSVKKDCGKRCPDFSIGCRVCQNYLMLDLFEDYLLDKKMFLREESK